MIKEVGSQKSDAVAAEAAETTAVGPSGATKEAAKEATKEATKEAASSSAAGEPSAVVAQAGAQTRQEMPGILEVLKAGKFQVSRNWLFLASLFFCQVRVFRCVLASL